jgi:uncharacterized membrane protein
MLAGLLYFLEKPYLENDKPWSYFSLPLLWGAIGIFTAFLSQVLYIRWSGNSDVLAFGSSLTSDLLWYRLLPNPTYPPGILLALTLVALPVILIMAGVIKRQARLSGWPLTGLIAYLVILFVDGLVVSVKIGGGGDLHNMDAFLVALMISAGYLLFGQLSSGSSVAPYRGGSWRLPALAVIIPILFTILPYTTLHSYDHPKTDHEVALIQEQAEIGIQSGEVLFISQRHLITFDIIPVPLSPDYELLTLMEMALSGNNTYLNTFYTDLRSHRFSLIIAAEQKVIQRGSAYSFGEENDAWVEQVARPILCYYEPVRTFQDLDVQLLIPRQISSSDCIP